LLAEVDECAVGSFKNNFREKRGTSMAVENAVPEIQESAQMRDSLTELPDYGVHWTTPTANESVFAMRAMHSVGAQAQPMVDHGFEIINNTASLSTLTNIGNALVEPMAKHFAGR
jgi:hypothetical protein